MPLLAIVHYVHAPLHFRGAFALAVDAKIGLVIPCFRVRDHIAQVLEYVGSEVDLIVVVDDSCPDQSGDYVKATTQDPRVQIVWHPTNQGVGGATMTGYERCLAAGMDVIVKMDGDGQMDSARIIDLVAPILGGEADYTKGNRFYDLELLSGMPKLRLLGNAVLSFMSKFSSGYWNIFDPTNGFTAIHARVAEALPLQKLSHRYFFESDMLFRLNIQRAVVMDIPMPAIYGEEVSHLRIFHIIPEFTFKHFRNLIKRIFYNFYLRDLSIASLELPVGLFLLLFGLLHGSYYWFVSLKTGIGSASGTVMLSALPIILGLQLILAFLSHDYQSVPTRPIHPRRRPPREREH